MKYWENPQVYITSAAEAAPHDAHFILHNFKTKDLQPFSDNVKGVSVMGELRYQVKLFPSNIVWHVVQYECTSHLDCY